MGAQNFDGLKAFTAAETISRYRLVKLDSSGNIVNATLGDRNLLGVAQDDVTSGNSTTVRILNSGGTVKLYCERPVNAGNHLLYPTYNGMVTSGALSGVSTFGTGFTALETITQGGLLEAVRNTHNQ